jgi:hypothetical protein
VTQGTSSSVPIFLCCAEDSEVFLVMVVDALRKEGMAPEVIAGVDTEPTLLSDLVDRTDSAALFVLCQSDALDKAQTRRLTGLFSARKGPCQRIITVQLYESRPLSILPGIRSGVKEVLKARAKEAGPRDSGERVNLREVVGPVGVSALRQSSTYRPPVPRDDQLPDLDGIDGAEALARELHEEMVAAEAILDRRENHRREGPRESPRESTRTSARETVELPKQAAAASAPVRPKTPPQEPGKSEPTPQRVSAALEDTKREPGAPAALLDTQALAAVPMDALEVSDEDDLELDTSPGSTAGEVTGPHASTSASLTPSGRSPVGLVAAVGGACALGLIAFSVVQRGDPPEDGGTRTGHAAARSEPAEPVPTPERAKPVQTPAVSGGEAAVVPPEEGDAVAARGRTVPPPPPPVDDDVAAINEAITDGRMRALDSILMLPPTTDTMTWDFARDHCRKQRVAGIGEWRMASKAEVNRLRRARLLPTGSYWSRQKGESDDEAIAWDSRSGRWVVWLTVEPNARALCVRQR